MTKKSKPKSKRKRKLRMLPLSRPSTPQDIIDRARQYGPASLDALADVVANGTDAAKVAAANSLLERGYGKVGQPIEFTGAGGGPVEMDIQVSMSPALAAALKSLADFDDDVA